MIGRKKKKVEDVNEFDVFGQPLDTFEEEESGTKKKKYFTRHPKQKYILLFILLIVTPFTVSFKFVEHKKVVEVAEAKELEATAKAESHTRLLWFIQNGDEKEAGMSAALLIGHTMETGCSYSYEELQEVFDDNSLRYLYDFLKGYTCKEYTGPSVVNISYDDFFGKYLAIVGNNQTKYLIKIGHDGRKLSTFTIEEYSETDNIKKAKEKD